MDLNKSILQDIRAAVGLDASTGDFDTDLLMYINSALGILSQNGVGNFLVVENEEQTWGNLQDPLQVEGNKSFRLIPLFVTLSTKILFDPPPPSSAQYHAAHIDQLLWRLKFAYETPDVIPTVEGSE